MADNYCNCSDCSGSEMETKYGDSMMLWLEAATGISTLGMSKHEWLDIQADNVSRVTEYQSCTMYIIQSK